MKIALIGPVYPFRGGIAHHTNMLTAYLRRHGHVVDNYTFSRQYSGVLFPGKTQEEPESGTAAGGEGRRTIDSINPLTWWKTARLLTEQGGYDLYLFQHWHPFFGPCFGSIAKRVRKRSRGEVMAIVHNFIHHESRKGDRFLTDRFLRHCTSAITQSTTVERQLAAAYPELPMRMQPHPVYENFGERVDGSPLRKRLGIENRKVILFFGLIRRYKGLDRLIEAMPEITRRLPDAHLLIAGEFYDDRGQYDAAIAASGLKDRITLHADYVPNEEVKEWFSASDVVVLPYRTATNSGIVQIAYNFSVPAIVTDVGSLSEVVLDGKTGYVIPDGSPNTIATAVEKIFRPGRIEEFARGIEGELAKYSWDSFVNVIEDLCQRPAVAPA